MKAEVVAQISNLLYRGLPACQRVERRGAVAKDERFADWKSAIQQVGNLRYIGAVLSLQRQELHEAFFDFVRFHGGAAEVFRGARADLYVHERGTHFAAEASDGVGEIGAGFKADGFPVIGGGGEGGEIDDRRGSGLATGGIVRFVVENDVKEICGLIITNGGEGAEFHEGGAIAVNYDDRLCGTG
jgi:hypothetical protein